MCDFTSRRLAGRKEGGSQSQWLATDGRTSVLAAAREQADAVQAPSSPAQSVYVRVSVAILFKPPPRSRAGYRAPPSLPSPTATSSGGSLRSPSSSPRPRILQTCVNTTLD